MTEALRSGSLSDLGPSSSLTLTSTRKWLPQRVLIPGPKMGRARPSMATVQGESQKVSGRDGWLEKQPQSPSSLWPLPCTKVSCGERSDNRTLGLPVALRSGNSLKPRMSSELTQSRCSAMTKASRADRPCGLAPAQSLLLSQYHPPSASWEELNRTAHLRPGYAFLSIVQEEGDVFKISCLNQWTMSTA